MEYKRGKLFETHSQRFPFLHTKQHKSLQKETGKQEHKLQKRRQKDLRKMTYCIHSKRNANLIHSVPGSFLAVPAAARGMGLARGESQSPVGFGEEQRFDCRCSGTARGVYVGTASAQGSLAAILPQGFYLSDTLARG